MILNAKCVTHAYYMYLRVVVYLPHVVAALIGLFLLASTRMIFWILTHNLFDGYFDDTFFDILVRVPQTFSFLCIGLILTILGFSWLEGLFSVYAPNMLEKKWGRLIVVTLFFGVAGVVTVFLLASVSVSIARTVFLRNFVPVLKCRLLNNSTV